MESEGQKRKQSTITSTYNTCYKLKWKSCHHLLTCLGHKAELLAKEVAKGVPGRNPENQYILYFAQCVYSSSWDAQESSAHASCLPSSPPPLLPPELDFLAINPQLHFSQSPSEAHRGCLVSLWPTHGEAQGLDSERSWFRANELQGLGTFSKASWAWNLWLT